MRQAQENSHSTLVDGQKRIDEKLTSLKEEIRVTYVDRVTHAVLEGRVKANEEKIVGIDGRMGSLNGYLGWIVKGVIGAVMTAGAAVLFAHGGIHP